MRYQKYLRALQHETPALEGIDQVLLPDVESLRGKARKEHEDTLDAITCAYVAAWIHWHGPAGAVVYGSLEDGHIVVPRRPPPGSWELHGIGVGAALFVGEERRDVAHHLVR
jgi:predicted RNase H-like nuclease